MSERLAFTERSGFRGNFCEAEVRVRFELDSPHPRHLGRPAGHPNLGPQLVLRVVVVDQKAGPRQVPVAVIRVDVARYLCGASP